VRVTSRHSLKAGCRSYLHRQPRPGCAALYFLVANRCAEAGRPVDKPALEEGGGQKSGCLNFRCSSRARERKRLGMR